MNLLKIELKRMKNESLLLTFPENRAELVRMLLTIK
jgi:hypothetical protein